MGKAADIRAKLIAGARVLMVDPGGFAPASAAQIAGHADVLFIDCERAPISVDQAAVMCWAAARAGVLPVVRSESGDGAILTRYLDAGAGGLVLPQVRTVQEVQHLADTLARHPAGRAGQVLAIPQIETTQAVAICAQLMGLSDIADAWLVGPNDLSSEMGLTGQPDHPRVRAAIADVAACARTARAPWGLPALTPALARDWAHAGARLFYIPQKALMGPALAGFSETE